MTNVNILMSAQLNQLQAPRYGAAPEDWDYFAVLLGVSADLLPVVSNPKAEISPDSNMKDLGKTPSRYNRSGKVAGIKGWAQHIATETDIARWSKEPDYGICIQTRYARAIDVDVADAALATRIRNFIEDELSMALPRRYRSNSGKFLLAFRLPGEYTKRRFKVQGGVIEFLATGQQFIAVGEHFNRDGASGARYQWDGGLPDDFPELGADLFERLWAALVAQFAIEEVKPERERTEVTAPAAPTDQVTLVSALAAIPNDGEGLMYDDWLAVVMAMHYETAASDDGLEITRAWSARSAKHSDDELELEWGRIKGASHSGKVVTGRSILHMAREHGWAEPVEQDFDVIKPKAGEPGDKVLPSFARNKNGEILVTMDNMVKAIERPDICGLQVGYDQFRDEIMYSEDGGQNWVSFKDADYSRIRIALERVGFKPPSKEITRDAVMLVADRNAFDSAQLWLNGLLWDGVPRVEGFLHNYMGVNESAYSKAVARYIWTALAGRVMEPGCKADMAVILVGKQGVRKSSGVAAIAPAREFFTEISFGEKEDDLSRKMRGRLVAELAELKGLHTRDSETIKAWMTRQYEDWTPKYREFNTIFPRRLLCLGTTNQDEFLADATGNRRWLPARVGGVVDVDAIIRDRLQLWAEARELWQARADAKGKDNGVDFEEAEKLAALEHDAYMMSDSWEPVIEAWLNEADPITDEKPSEREFLQVHEVLEGALRQDAKNCKRVEEMRIGAVLRTLGYTRKRMRVSGRLAWVYVKVGA